MCFIKLTSFKGVKKGTYTNTHYMVCFFCCSHDNTTPDRTSLYAHTRSHQDGVRAIGGNFSNKGARGRCTAHNLAREQSHLRKLQCMATATRPSPFVMKRIITSGIMCILIRSVKNCPPHEIHHVGANKHTSDTWQSHHNNTFR